MLAFDYSDYIVTIDYIDYIEYIMPPTQGTNARKVISEVYAFFVLQCTVFGRKSKHKTDVTA